MKLEKRAVLVVNNPEWTIEDACQAVEQAAAGVGIRLHLKDKVEKTDFSLDTAAEMIDCEVRHLRDECLLKRVPGAWKFGKEWRIPAKALEELRLKGLPRSRGRRV